MAGEPGDKKLVTLWCDMWEFLALSLFSGESKAAVRNISVSVGRTVVTLILINIVCDSQPSRPSELE